MRRFSPDSAVPGLRRTAPLLAVAGLVTAVISAILVVRDGHDLPLALGDTDDATRLVMMRGLLHGRGWWDQLLTRYQPPTGVWMHWSRLLDGGLAAMTAAFGVFVPPARAELLTRTVWPLLWILPATAATLLAARRLAGRDGRGPELRGAAVLAAGVVVLVSFGQLTLQFRPGRVDHHDVQITLALVTLAGAMTSGVRGAVVAATATGVGLAIGLEALLFEAVLAASLGLRVVLDRRQAPRAVAFGLTLAAVTGGCFLLQTPPQRWGVPACDALGSNLAVGAVLAGLGLAGASWLTRARSWTWRLGFLAVAGGAALAVYLALDPRCTHGIFADVDPAIRPFWLDHVNEVKHWPRVWKDSRTDAVAIALAALMGGGAWLALGLVPARRRDPAWWTLGGALALAVLAAWTAVRMRGYLEWFAVAPLAVAAAELGTRAPRLRWLAVILAAAAFSPIASTGAVLAYDRLLPRKPPPHAPAHGAAPKPAAKAADPPDFCYDDVSYAALARLPAGVTVSEIDLGPFVTALTPSSTMSAPYHRMSLGIMTARRILVAPVDEARAKAAAVSPGGRLGPVYLLECRRHRGHADRDHLASDSLQARLDAGLPPAWLTPLTPPGAALEVFRVTTPAPAGPTR